MQIQVSTNREIHRGVVPSLSWCGQELITIGDDGSIHRWDGIKSGRPISPASLAAKKTQNEKAVAIFTSISFHPSASSGYGIGKSGGGGGRRCVVNDVDLLALSCTDGTIRLATASGLREIKKIQAHTGAAVRVRWSNDGTAFCSCGEDGTVKPCSDLYFTDYLRYGHNLVYAVSWSPDGESLVAGSGKSLTIKSLQSGKQIAQWKVHGRTVTCIDWNIRTGQILSASEDCTYAVWDSFGQRMFASAVHSHAITSVAWAPNGKNFAVGSFNILKIYDAMGWTRVQHHLPKVGSLLDIRWMENGTQLAASGGNGAVVFAQVIGQTLCWRNLDVVLVEVSRIELQDSECGKTDILDLHGNRIVKMALGFEHLVVITGTQCFVYNVTNLSTPIIFDFEGDISILSLADTSFLTLDSLCGIRVWDYEGQLVSHLKVQNLLPRYANDKSISLSPEVVAIVNSTDRQLVQIYDTSTGLALPDGNISNDSEIIEISLSQFNSGGILNRRLVFLDKDKNLWIAPVKPIPGLGNGKVKLRSQVDSFRWSNACAVLSALADGHLGTWLYPNGVYVDIDLMEAGYISKDMSELGSSSQIIAFDQNRVSIRKANGAIVAISIPPFPAMLHSLIQKNNWDEAVRLCRLAQNMQLWACTACMAIERRELEVAENALAVIKMVDKLEYIVCIRGIRSEACQNAQLALFQRRPDEAEIILLQASPPLIYNAIKMNVLLLRWQRALDLALQYQDHLDIVLGYRQKHLGVFRKKETDSRFIEIGTKVKVDWDAVRETEKRFKE